jgi:DNA-binding response OmpR family regulator
MAGTRTVLVVDDDPSIRLLCRVNLELEGFDVIEAHDVAGAVANAPAVQLVLLDLHLGPDRGRGVVDPVRAAAPDVPLVLLTGSVEVEGELKASVAQVVTKPFTIDGLLEAVKRHALSV